MILRLTSVASLGVPDNEAFYTTRNTLFPRVCRQMKRLPFSLFSVYTAFLLPRQGKRKGVAASAVNSIQCELFISQGPQTASYPGMPVPTFLKQGLLTSEVIH